ncbi:MAG: hypothetical protein KF819_34365 [Labilithrix sp.]|nr:hypothetical protein [Labilithrix sp.]
MPYYVNMRRIDCHYDQASSELRAILPDANSSLSSSNHTSQTFEEQLRKLAAERHDLVVDALLEDGFRGYWLYRARAGKVSAIEVDERPEGALDREVDLPLDDMATVTLVRHVDEIRAMLAEQPDVDGDDGYEVTLPLRYADEGSMRNVLDLVSKAIDAGEHRFVAEVELERFLVEIGPGAASVRKLVVVTEPDLFSRLLHGQFADVPEPPPRADEMREQALYWPEDMLRAIKEEAFRLDTSLSNIVQKAWKASRAKVAESQYDGLSPLLRGFSRDKAKQTLYFPGDMLVEIRDQAARIDASLSFVVQGAWVLARDAIAALPPPKDSR